MVKKWQLVYRSFTLWYKYQHWYKWVWSYREYRLIKHLLSIPDGRQKSKMAATKFSFFAIPTSDRGDFPRIIEIASFSFHVGTPLHFYLLRSFSLYQFQPSCDVRENQNHISDTAHKGRQIHLISLSRHFSVTSSTCDCDVTGFELRFVVRI